MGYLDQLFELRKVYNKKIKEILEYLDMHDAYANTTYYHNKENERIILKQVVKDLTKVIDTF